MDTNVFIWSWWRHQMESFSASLALCVGNSPVPGEFPSQRPVTRSFEVFFDLCLNKQLSKQSWGWWFETFSRPLWRHCNGFESNQTSNYQGFGKLSLYLPVAGWFIDNKNTYRQISNITRTKYQNLNVSRFVLQLSLPKPLKPGVKSIIKI